MHPISCRKNIRFTTLLLKKVMFEGVKQKFRMKKEYFLSFIFDYLNICLIFAVEVVKLLVRIV